MLSLRNSFLALALMFICALPSRAQNPLISGDSLMLVENELKKLGKNVNFTIVPGPVYGATQKLGFMVLPMIVYDLNRQDKLSPPSSTGVMLYFDFYGSWQLAAKQSLYWNQNKWRAFASTGGGKMQLKFFGIGRDTVIVSNDESNYIWTTGTDAVFSTSCYRKIVSGFYGGLEYAYTYSFIEAGDSAGTVKLESNGIHAGEKLSESILVPTFVWDNRNNIFWTTKGYYASLDLQFSNQLFFSDKNYGIITGKVSGYHKLIRNSEKLSLAWHFYLQAGWGDLPYSRYANYGHGDNAVGYTRGKYIDNSEFSAQTELRYDLWKFISIGGYAGTGKVYPSLDKVWKSVWLHFGGLRAYVNILPSRNIRLRLDIAVARKDWGFYVGMGQGF